MSSNSESCHIVTKGKADKRLVLCVWHGSGFKLQRLIGIWLDDRIGHHVRVTTHVPSSTVAARLPADARNGHVDYHRVQNLHEGRLHDGKRDDPWIHLAVLGSVDRFTSRTDSIRQASARSPAPGTGLRSGNRTRHDFWAAAACCRCRV